MNKKFIGLSVAGMLVASLLGAGIVYAANGGPSAADKKQLGLFSGNGDFIGTVLDVNTNEYTSYNSSLDAVIKIIGDHDNGGFIATSLSIDNVYYEGTGCTGKAFIDLQNVSGSGGIVPQELFIRSSSGKPYMDTKELGSLGRTAVSSLDTDDICHNFSPQLLQQTRVIKEVTLPFAIVAPVTIQTL